MRALASRIVEWLFSALREWRIGATIELEGEDAVPEADKAWAARRAARAKCTMHNAECRMNEGAAR